VSNNVLKGFLKNRTRTESDPESQVTYQKNSSEVYRTTRRRRFFLYEHRSELEFRKKCAFEHTDTNLTDSVTHILQESGVALS